MKIDKSIWFKLDNKYNYFTKYAILFGFFLNLIRKPGAILVLTFTARSKIPLSD